MRKLLLDIIEVLVGVFFIFLLICVIHPYVDVTRGNKKYTRPPWSIVDFGENNTYGFTDENGVVAAFYYHSVEATINERNYYKQNSFLKKPHYEPQKWKVINEPIF